MNARNTKPAKPANLDLTGGKFSVISFGDICSYVLPTAAAMKVLDLMRSSVPVRQDFNGLRNRQYVIQPVRERYNLEILNQADEVRPAKEGEDVI